MPEKTVPDINFKPEELQQNYKTKPIIEWLDKTGKTILIFVEAIILIFLGVNFYFSRTLNDLTQQYNSLKEQTTTPEDIKLIENHKILQEEVETIKNITDTQIDWEERLKTLQEKIPSDLIIRSYEFTGNMLSIEAGVSSVQGFAFFISKLRNDPEIKSITLVQSEYNNQTKEFSFGMEILL